MASLTSAAAVAVVIPSPPTFKSCSTRLFATPRFFPSTNSLSTNLSVKASFKDAAAAVIATAATAALASNAMAIDVLLGTDDGRLAFYPDKFSVSPGEEIVFINHAGFPHNVIFDEDDVPPGVDVTKISMGDEDLLNARDEKFSVKLTEKGKYKFYCTPHQGAGMYGYVTVN